MQRMLFILVFMLVAMPALALAEIVEQDVAYEHGGVGLMGRLAYDASLTGPLPGVVVVHEWWGLGEHPKDSARKLAEMGYAAFALDMYGKGVLTASAKEAAELSKPFRRDRKLMRTRAEAGLKALIDSGKADPGNIAAIGYCFGGTTVLEMARAGQPLAGVVSFHGNLATPMPASSMSCPALVLHGAADPLVGVEEVRGFMSEMRDVKADWQVVYFGGAVHSFTNPAAGNEPGKGSAYNPVVARRAWEYMRVFLEEVLGR